MNSRKVKPDKVSPQSVGSDAAQTKKHKDLAAQLRNDAERIIKDNASTPVATGQTISHDEMDSIIHDLQVHQIELQVQNDELLYTQDELEESRTKYFELYNLAPVGYLTFNEKGHITETNLTFSNLVGFSKQFILKHTITQFIYPADQDIFYKFKRQLETSSGAQTCELRMLGKDEKQIWTKIEAIYVYGKTSIEYTCQCAISNITKRKDQEKLLTDQYELLQALINSPEESIYSLDSKYCFTAINSHYREEKRRVWDKEIKIGDCIFDFMTPDEMAEAKQYMDRVFRGESFVNVVLTPQDDYLEIDWNPIYDESKKAVGLTAFLRNITERKRAETIIQNSNELLEQKVRERTSELEMSKSELEAFSSSVAHDLSNCICTIEGYSKILLEDYSDVLDDNARDILDVINHSARKMDMFVNALLHLARLQQSEIGYTPIKMTQHVNHIWEELDAENKDAIKMNIDSLPEAMGDSRLIQVVWQTLLTNAVKFTRNCPVRDISVSGITRGRFVEYCIADTGVGFDMEHYARLFQVFHTLHERKDYGGSGVGLAIAQRIIKMHGGQIWAIGAVGKGAQFYFTLPVVE